MAAVPTPHQFAVGEVATADNINTYYSGISYLENLPIAVLYQVTPQSIPNNTATPLNFDGSNIDSYNGHSISGANNSRYVAQVPGWYELSAVISYQQNNNGGRLIKMQKNGADILSSACEQPPSTDFNSVMCSPTIMVSLAINDYIQVLGLQDSGGSLNTLTATAFTSGFFIRWVHV